MVDSLWFVLALVLLAVVSVALVLVLVLQREEAALRARDPHRVSTDPTMGRPAGSGSASAPSNETIIPYR